MKIINFKIINLCMVYFYLSNLVRKGVKNVEEIL